MASGESTINLGGYHGTYGDHWRLIRRVLWAGRSDFGDKQSQLIVRQNVPLPILTIE